MDRRHLVLGIAVLAVLAHKRADPPPLFEGHEVLDAGSLEIEAHGSTTWIVKAEVELPPESNLGFSSWLDVSVDVPDPDAEAEFSVAARTCGHESILATITVPDETDTGEHEGAYWLGVEGLFDGCPAEEPCASAVCLDASNETDAVLTLEVQIQAGLEADTGEYGNDETLEVPISLSFEEKGG